jgi:hypothetical protein
MEKKGKDKQVATSTLAGVDEGSSQFNIYISMVSYLSSNTISSVGYYVDNEASRHMTYDRKLFNGFQEQEGGTCVELGDDATYLMIYWDPFPFGCHQVMFLS